MFVNEEADIVRKIIETDVRMSHDFRSVRAEVVEEISAARCTSPIV